MCDFPEIWAIPFKSNFLTGEKMNSKLCHDTLGGIPEYFQKHQHLLLSIEELPIFYIAKMRFSRILSHPQKSFFDQRKDEFENLSRYTCWHTRVPSKTPAPVALHWRASIFYIAKMRFSRILSHPFQKSFYWPEKRWIRTSVKIHLLACHRTFKNTSTCWHARVLSKTPAPVALHRRAYDILHCKGAIFTNFEPSLLIQKSFFWPEKRLIRKSVTVHLLAYQSTYKNTSTCCSPS